MPDCWVCGEHFTRQWCLNRHLEIHFRTEDYHCEDCNKAYARRDNLQKHRKGCQEALRKTTTVAGRTNVSTAEHSQHSGIRAGVHPINHQSSTVTTGIIQEAVCHNDPGQTSSVDLEAQEHHNVSLNHIEGSNTAQTSLSSNYFNMTASPQAHHWDYSFENNPQPAPLVPYDDLGRVNAAPWMLASNNAPPCPEFLLEMVEKLRQKYQGIQVEGVMHLGLVCLATRTPFIRPHDGRFGQTAFQQQYLPTIRCLDCTEQQSFAVTPLQSLRSIKEHMNHGDHPTVRSNRRHEVWLAAHVGAPLPIVQRIAQNSAVLTDQTILILAVKEHSIHTLRWLLNDGFKVQEKDSSQRSALHWACFLGRNDMAELLLQYGARLDEQDAELKTPLDLALGTGRLSVAMHLVQVLAQLQQKQSPQFHDTALAHACHLGRLSIVEAMIEAGADVNGRGANTPLELALRDAPWPIVQVLLRAGAYTNTIDQQHRVLLLNKRNGLLLGGHETEDYADAEMKIRLLKDYGLDLDATRHRRHVQGRS